MVGDGHSRHNPLHRRKSCHDLLRDYYTFHPKSCSNGMAVIAGIDGYRAAFTLSEIVNRNDQQEILIIDRDNYEGAGRFSLFPQVISSLTAP